MQNDEIIRRFDEQFAERRGNFDQDADFIERYIAPIRAGKFFQQQSSEFEIQFRRPEVYDSTAMNASNILASSIQGAITPADTKWFDLLFRVDTLNDDQQAKEWLEECGNRMFLALQDSAFELSNQEAMQDLVDFGNTVVFEEEIIEDDEYQGLLFDTVPIREIYFEEDWDQTILNFYRRLQWTPLQIASRFPADQIPQVVTDKLNSPSAANVRMDVIFCIYPRKGKQQVEAPAAPENRPYGYKYVLKKEQETIGEEGGYYEMPAFLARWAKTSGSKWGHGCGHLALPSVLTLNNMAKDELAYIEKIIDPPSLVSERNIFGDLDLTAGGVTVVQDIEGVQPYLSGSQYGEFRASQQDLREVVRSIYRVDQLQLKESPAMTATEAQMRYEEILRLLGPVRGRLETEYLDEVLQRTFNIMYRNGQFEDPPESVVNSASGAELDIKYLGPMARAQKMDRVASIERWMLSVGNGAQVLNKPEMVDSVDSDAVVKELAELGGVPAKLMKDAKEVQKDRDKRDELAQKMAEATAAQETGAGMQAMAEGEQALRAVE